VLARSMQQGTLFTREAYMALLRLKSFVDLAVEHTRAAGFETIGLAISPRHSDDPLFALNKVTEALQSQDFETAVFEARSRVEHAAAWLHSHKA
jgi:hypothetical protein